MRHPGIHQASNDDDTNDFCTTHFDDVRKIRADLIEYAQRSDQSEAAHFFATASEHDVRAEVVAIVACDLAIEVEVVRSLKKSVVLLGTMLKTPADIANYLRTFADVFEAFEGKVSEPSSLCQVAGKVTAVLRPKVIPI